MKVMRAALQTHDEWFKLQMCKDRFESLLKIDTLKEVDTLFFSGFICSSDPEACGCVQLSKTTKTPFPHFWFRVYLKKDFRDIALVLTR